MQCGHARTPSFERSTLLQDIPAPALELLGVLEVGIGTVPFLHCGRLLTISPLPYLRLTGGVQRRLQVGFRRSLSFLSLLFKTDHAQFDRPCVPFFSWP